MLFVNGYKRLCCLCSLSHIHTYTLFKFPIAVEMRLPWPLQLVPFPVLTSAPFTVYGVADSPALYSRWRSRETTGGKKV